MILHFYTKDHPETNKRTPIVGDQQWTFTFDLSDGNQLLLHLGRECHDTFRGFILREELDDAADVAENAHHARTGVVWHVRETNERGSFVYSDVEGRSPAEALEKAWAVWGRNHESFYEAYAHAPGQTCGEADAEH